MYHKAYGIIETLAPLHVGASVGEETGNLNLIFRDQFTQTGIIPGSSIRGRFRADMRQKERSKNTDNRQDISAEEIETETPAKDETNNKFPLTNKWYGHNAVIGKEDSTTEAEVKFEYASIVWLPVFCPGQPVVWVTCPKLLKRYQRLVSNSPKTIPTINDSKPNDKDYKKCPASPKLFNKRSKLFFNLGFIHLKADDSLNNWVSTLPPRGGIDTNKLIVVSDNDISLIHDMALYRQSRVKLSDTEKRVEGSAFFNVEALPEGSILVFPVAVKQKGWSDALILNDLEWKAIDNKYLTKELYFGGLESVGFGRCSVTLGGNYQ